MLKVRGKERNRGGSGENERERNNGRGKEKLGREKVILKPQSSAGVTCP